VARREDAAFAALLERHGPLVLGVCRRVLGGSADADDAFQATFLVLVGKAGSIRNGASVASWLHGVARRVALEARTRAARWRAREAQVADNGRSEPADDAAGRERCAILDEELGQLTPKYREPLVLHYLVGQTKEETARQLGWSEGTVSGRLARARDLLRDRLTRRGVALSGGAAAAFIPEALAVVPATLADATAGLAALVAAGEGAAGAGTARVVALAAGVAQDMSRTRLKGAAAVLLVAAGVGLGAAGLISAQQPRQGPDAAPSGPAVAGVSASEAAVDNKLGEKELVLTGHTGRVLCVCVSADGKRLLTCSDADKTLRLWDADTGKFLRVFEGHTDGVISAALSPDGKRVLSGGVDKTVRLWDTDTGKELRKMTGHTGLVWSVAFGPEGQALSGGGGDGTMRI
jgi:RNA polymerase sigma factor (sigma-70 family)